MQPYFQALFGVVGGKTMSFVQRALLHGLIGGSISALGGGRFGSGFLGAFASGLLSPQIEGLLGAAGTGGIMGTVLRTVASAIVGGISRKLGGGKFLNGAAMAAFARLFNDERHGAQKSERVGASDDKQREGQTQCTSPPISDLERGYSRNGDRRSFWESREARGDPLGPVALAIVDNVGIGMVANSILEDAIIARNQMGIGTGLTAAAEANQIGVTLMRQHVAAVDLYRTPSPSQIAKYHWQVFAAHFLRASTFGGTPISGAKWEAETFAGVWLRCH